MKNRNRMPRRKLIEKIDEVHGLDDTELIRRRQAWQPIAKPGADGVRIIKQLDQEIARRDVSVPVSSNVYTGAPKKRIVNS